jgi:hypothetical protein
MIRYALAPIAILTAACAPAALADDTLPPFDFSDAFYLANGINPVGLPGRPTGNPPNSIIDNRENGPDLNNVRILSTAATYDASGHRHFFYVTGLLRENNFTNDAAGQEARALAEFYKVYEFPKVGAPQFSVFPKRQDSVSDTRNGYFSNNPLGVWQVNIINYTPAAFNTPDGRRTLAELGARNGFDNDGTPLIKTMSEIESLLASGLVEDIVPPANTTALRWFFCPVIEDPRNGAIAPDAFLGVTQNTDAPAFRQLFACLQATGDECPQDPQPCYANCDSSTASPMLNILDFNCFLNRFASASPYANCDGSLTEPMLNILDFNCFLNRFSQGCGQ